MDLQLNGRRAIVTGGSRGIGLATARALADEGARVALFARDAGALESAAAALRAEGAPEVLAVAVDTTDDDAVRRGVTRSRTGSVGWTCW